MRINRIRRNNRLFWHIFGKSGCGSLCVLFGGQMFDEKTQNFPFFFSASIFFFNFMTQDFTMSHQFLGGDTHINFGMTNVTLLLFSILTGIELGVSKIK